MVRGSRLGSQNLISIEKGSAAGKLCGGRRGEGMRDGRSEEIKQRLDFEMRFVCPAGTAAFLVFSFGRLRRGQMGAC